MADNGTTRYLPAPTAGEVDETSRYRGVLMRGQRFGRYRIEELLGTGGLGDVYRACDLDKQRIVALKIIRSLDPRVLPRFRKEAAVLRELNHPNVVRLIEAGEVDGRHYLAMEFVEGTPVEEVPLSIPEAVRILRDAAKALEYLHSKGIVHRDIKPSNLLLDGSKRVILTDFDIAKQLDAGTRTTLGGFVGTAPYVSPEQAAGDSSRVDPRSDIYSLGATAYFLLTRRDPFQGRSQLERMYQMLNHPPLPPRALNPSIRPELESIVLKAMARVPEDRYATAGEMARELERVMVLGPGRTTLATATRFFRLRLQRRDRLILGLLVPASLALCSVVLGAATGELAFAVLFASGILAIWFGGAALYAIQATLRARRRGRALLRQAEEETARLAAGVHDPALREERVAQVRSRIEEALAEWPGLHGVEVLEGILSYHSGHPQRALCYLEQADHLRTADFRVPYYKGLIYLERYFNERGLPAAIFDPIRRKNTFSPPPQESPTARLWRNKGIRAMQQAWERIQAASADPSLREEAHRKRKLIEGALALYDGRYRDSRILLEPLGRSENAGPEALYFYALACYHDNEILAFIEAVEALLARGHRSARIYRAAGAMYRVLGQMKESEGRDPTEMLRRSLEMFSRAIESSPHWSNYGARASAYYWLARHEARRHRDYSGPAEAAIRDLQEAFRLEPNAINASNLAEILCEYAWLEERRGGDAAERFRQAREAAERVLGLECTERTRVRAVRLGAEARIGLARVELRKGGDPRRLCREALQELDRVEPHAGQDLLRVDIVFNRGQAFSVLADAGEAGAREEAVACFTRCIRMFPEYEAPYLERSRELERQGRHAEALRDLEKACELVPELHDVFADRLERLRRTAGTG